MAVRFDDLFAAIDARPFRPFRIELVSGTLLEVTHPENIAVFPTRQRVHHIEVYQGEAYEMSLVWPEGFAGLQFPAPEAPSAG